MNNKLLLAIVCVFIFWAVWAKNVEADQGGQLVRFLNANTAYKSGNFDEALKIYQEITSEGFESAAVYYNIANCYMKKNELGSALVWYERARRLDPRDADLRANWLYARSMMKNPEVNAVKDWMGRVFIHIENVTEDEIVMILCLICVVVSLLFLVGLYLGWRFKKTVIILVLLSVVFVFHVFALIYKIESLADRAVLLSSVDVKYEPEEAATTHFTGYEGWKVRVLKESADWVKIERPDGLTGWVAKDKLQRI